MENRDDQIRIAVALTLCPGIGPVKWVQLYRQWSNQWEDLPSIPSMELGITAPRATKALSGSGWYSLLDRAEESLHRAFLAGIQVHWVQDKRFPIRLGPERMPDGPLVIYTKGDPDALSSLRTMGTVGTRRPTAYGLACTELWIQGVQVADPVIVSGLAFGVDAAAHDSAMRNSLKTVAVLAHGLHSVHPVAHKNMAADILDAGGCWLSELAHGVDPEPGTFPQRNRLIAGMSDVLFIPEAGANSGTLITARMALDYNKPVYAIPGRIGDGQSEGCLALLSSYKATIAFRPGQMLEDLLWEGIPERAGPVTEGCLLAVQAAVKDIKKRRKQKAPFVFRRDSLYPLCPGWSRWQIQNALQDWVIRGDLLYDVVKDVYSSRSSSSVEAFSDSSSSSDSSSNSASTGTTVGTASRSSK